jgi:hypothetical protein
MLGSVAAEPVAVCDTAVPLKLHSNEIDKIAIAEGPKRLDEDLMTLSFQIQDDYAVLGRTVPHIFNSYLFNSYLPKTRCVVCFWHETDMPTLLRNVRS